MDRKFITIPALLWIVLFFNSSGGSQTVSKIKGVVYADYYYNISNYDAAENDQNSFKIRRIYFTFENNLFANIKIRFRIESAHTKFGQGGPINPFVKHAYLEWTNLIPNHKLYLGIAETNGFNNTEKYWAYRPIEKTNMDLNKISASADMGIALKGDLGNIAHHWFTLYNGTGYKNSEQDKFKKVSYSFWLTPVNGLILEGYFDYEKQDPNNAMDTATDFFGATSYHTIKAFLGYRTPGFTIGVEAFWYTNNNSGTTDTTGVVKTDVTKRGFSFFGSWNTPIPRIKLFARYDIYDPNIKNGVWISQTENGLDDEFVFFIAGIDFIPKDNIHFVPNILIKNYTLDGKKSDITARITLFYNFDTGKIVI